MIGWLCSISMLQWDLLFPQVQGEIMGTQQTTKGSFLGNLMPNWFNIFFSFSLSFLQFEGHTRTSIVWNHENQSDLRHWPFVDVVLNDQSWRLTKNSFLTARMFFHREVQLGGMFFTCKIGGSKVSFLNASQIKPSHNHCQILNLSNIHLLHRGKKGFIPWQQYLSDHASWTTT